MHTDIIKKITPFDEQIVMTGSYDGSVKATDFRTGKEILQLAAGSAVEDLLLLQGSRLVAVATQNRLQIWDTRNT